VTRRAAKPEAIVMAKDNQAKSAIRPTDIAKQENPVVLELSTCHLKPPRTQHLQLVAVALHRHQRLEAQAEQLQIRTEHLQATVSNTQASLPAQQIAQQLIRDSIVIPQNSAVQKPRILIPSTLKSTLRLPIVVERKYFLSELENFQIQTAQEHTPIMQERISQIMD
jgi:hypothetical protein